MAARIEVGHFGTPVFEWKITQPEVKRGTLVDYKKDDPQRIVLASENDRLHIWSTPLANVAKIYKFGDEIERLSLHDSSQKLPLALLTRENNSVYGNFKSGIFPMAQIDNDQYSFILHIRPVENGPLVTHRISLI